MKKIAITAAACAALACFGHGKQKPEAPVTVSDSDYGRIAPGQTQIVDAARAELTKAKDEEARAKLNQTDAQQEDQLAQADLQAVAASKTRADSMAKSANESRDPTQLAQAEAARQSADLRRRTAEAHMDYAKKLQASRSAAVTAATQRVAYESSRVELAKLQALQAAQVPAASKYDQAKMEAQVAASRKNLEQAEGQARSSEAGVSTSQRSWEELNRQFQASSQQAGMPTR